MLIEQSHFLDIICPPYYELRQFSILTIRGFNFQISKEIAKISKSELKSLNSCPMEVVHDIYVVETFKFTFGNFGNFF